MQKINIIHQTLDGEQTTFQLDYIKEILFKRFKQNTIFDNAKLETVLDNSVIVYSNNSRSINEEFKNYLEKFVDKKYKFYLFHLSNESLNHDCEYYSKADLVLRSYYDPNIKLNNVIFIPLGIKSGFLNNTKEDVEKEYNFSFIGQPKSDRLELLSVLSSINNVFIHQTRSWNCVTSLNQEACKRIYKKTKFVPCPMGWTNPDSHRIMECLECDSVPVLKSYNNLEYFKKCWGENFPFPVVDHWGEIKDLVSISDKEYKKLLKETKKWYVNFKKNVSLKILNEIKNEN